VAGYNNQSLIVLNKDAAKCKLRECRVTLQEQVDIREAGRPVAGVEEMGQTEGGTDKAGVGVGVLEAHSNEMSTTGGGGTQDRGYPWGARYQWLPPTNNLYHPKIAALMNPYLDHFNGLLVLPELLKNGKVCYEDLPFLNLFRNPTTGRATVC
jgi:hypothetical protein